MSGDRKYLDYLLSETGVNERLVRIDPERVAGELKVRYGLTGALERVSTEKDDTFILTIPSGGKFLVKCSPSTEKPGLVDLQSAAILHMEHHAPEIPAQRLYTTKEGEYHVPIDADGQYLRLLRVLDFIPGTVMAELEPTPEQMNRAGQMLGRLTRAMASFGHPQDGRAVLWDMQHFHRLTALLDYVKNPAHRQLAEEIFHDYQQQVVPLLDEIPRQVIHGDFSPFNVVADPDRPEFITGVLDFGDISRTAVIFDVVVGMANALGVDRQHPWKHALSFLEGYTASCSLPARYTAVLGEIALGRMLLRALVSHWSATVDPERHAYMLSHAAQDWDCIQTAVAARDDNLHEVLHRAGTAVPTEER